MADARLAVRVQDFTVGAGPWCRAGGRDAERQSVAGAIRTFGVSLAAAIDAMRP